MNANPPTNPSRLPDFLRKVLWEYDFDSLSWEKDRDLVIARVLRCGEWPMIRWLREQAGDDFLRDWIEQREGAGLGNRQLRFWQLVIGVRKELVDQWIRNPQRSVWETRTDR